MHVAKIRNIKRLNLTFVIKIKNPIVENEGLLNPMKINSKFTDFLLCLLFSSALTLLSSCSLVGQGDSFKLGASLNIPRARHSATLMQDGRVLIAGGFTMGDFFHPKGDVLQAEIYDPKTNQFKLTDSFKAKVESLLSNSEAPLLPDGRVAFIGKQAQFFDPKSEKFILAGRMVQERSGDYTVTLLQDGKILITGGLLPSMGYVTTNQAEMFNPVSGIFSETGPLHFNRFMHAAVLLKDGRVLVLGGADGKGEGGCVNPPEIYNPITGNFSLSKARMLCRLSYTPMLLPNGNVLLHGGGNSMKGHQFESLPDEIYLTNQDKVTIQGKTVRHRTTPAVNLLQNGKILYTGGNSLGFGDASILQTTELYDYQTGKYQFGPLLARKRIQFGQTVLRDGTVLITGGLASHKTIGVSELYSGE